MSDIEDEPQEDLQGSDVLMPDADDGHDVGGGISHKRRDVEEDQDEEEDDEENDDDDEEDEDGDEEISGRKGKKRAKHRHRRSAASRFLDIEAEVSDEDEEEEEDEDYGAEGFIETTEDVEEDASRRHHALLDNKRQLDEEDKSPEQIAREVKMRHVGRAAARYTGDLNEIPQRLLMPSVHDASLWQVRVKPGRERELIFSLMRKSIDVEYTARPLSILAAFERDSLPGMIYVEARSAKQVQEACNGLVGVYPSRGIQLVPIEEMASLLQIKKQDLTVTPGSWVRIKRGKYSGDLAQVVDITENGEDVGLKFIPRIDLNPRDDASLEGVAKKRKKTGGTGAGTMRPPQRLFNYEEVIKVWGRKNVSKRNQVYTFQGDTFKDGFIEKDFKLSGLILEDVNPTLDEITQFTRREDGAEGDNLVDLSIIAEASRKAAISVLQPGDHVEVFEGEQSGVHGVVEEISGDVVTIAAVGVDIEGQKVELPARSVRKRFKPGDHVKVMSGQNADETGLVVSVADNVVTFLSDMSMQEVSVFSKDLREAAEVGSGTNIVGNYELHDLVQLDAQTVGVIFKTERDSFRVLDQHGQVRLVQPHQISMRRDSNRAIATDSEGHELRINDNMKETEGEGRKGRVLHIFQSFFAFLHNRDIVENGGVFVTRARSLVSLAPKGNVLKTAGTDLSKMNPSLVASSGGMVGSGAMGRGPRDRHIGATVVVVKGPHKGYAGTIKDTNGQIARVELRTGNKIISIEKDKLYRRLPDGKLEKLDSFQAGPPRNGGRNPYGGPGGGGGGFGSGANNQPPGGRTPWGGVNAGRTPNPYGGDGRTPAWNIAGRTPNPYASESGKTPAWNASSRTPNPYAADGGRTPAWTVGSRTPNPYAAGANAASGSSNAYGGATPGRPAMAGGSAWNGDAAPNWGGATPARGAWDSDTWSAPTPAAAATPGMSLGQTPAYSAQTPGISARTPAGVWGSSSEMSAPTPGATWGSYDESKSIELAADWVLDPIFSNIKTRMKVKIRGTRATNYLDGQFEDKTGRIEAEAKTSGIDDQTVLVVFPDGVKRSFLAKYITPVAPTQLGEEVMVLAGEHKGTIAVVREKPEDEDTAKVAISTKSNPNSVFDPVRSILVCLYDS